jgi:O-acetyl-ADP-ribose deacetylase (regulator of RNase III)
MSSAEKAKIEIVQGDLTEMATDAIVNAANNDLILGGGLAGAIARKGGPAIQEECSRIGPIEVGEAAITTGGNLRALWVIHAASMSLGSRATAEALRSSARASLRIARGCKLKSIALPAVGAGIAGFPMKECAEIMIGEAIRHLEHGSSLERVVFVLFDRPAYETFLEVYSKL